MPDIDQKSPRPDSPVSLFADDEASDQELMGHAQQLADLQKLLETAHENEEKAIARAKIAEEKLAEMEQEFTKTKLILSDKEFDLIKEEQKSKEKDKVIEKLTSERDRHVEAEQSLQKSNLFLQAAHKSIFEQAKEQQQKHEKELNAVHQKHFEDFSNSSKRQKKAIKGLYDTLKNREMEIAILKQALNMHEMSFYASSQATFFPPKPSEKIQHDQRALPAESKKYKRG